ncbi:MAG TPA: PAS domain-containing protein, partial [Hanamia sp.]
MKIEKAQHIAKSQAITVNCDAMISFRSDGIIFQWNDVAENIFGYPAIDAIGRNISLVFPINYFKDPEAFVNKKEESSSEFESVCKTKNGDRINLLFHVFPINNESEM